MPRLFIGRRAMTVALSLALLASAFPLAGLVGAASASTTCSTFTGEGTYSQCWLDIRTPSSVPAGTAFTVQVAVTTNESKSIVATSDPCGSKALITLGVTPVPPPPPPEGPLPPPPTTVYYQATASAGIATFNLNITTPGDYSLDATGPSNDASIALAPSTANCGSYRYVSDHFAPLTIVFIPANAPIAPCPPDTSCVQASSGGDTPTQATLIATLGSHWNPKNPNYFGPVVAGVNKCGSSTPLDPNGVLSYTLSTTDGTTTAVIILAIDPKGQGVGLFNVCWTQLVPFTPLGGGAQVTTGDLPNCKQRDQMAPCVIARTGGSGGKVVFLTILATASLDPAAYGH